MAEAKEKNDSCIRKILAAVDEGEESLYALSWCLNNLIIPSHNSKEDTLLILLHAKPPMLIYSALDGSGYLLSGDVLASMERYRDRVTNAVLEKATELCKLGDEVKVVTKVEDGDARDVICEAVEKLGVDLLVMGNHGYGFLKRTFLGSVSNHCAQNVKCPVLIVKRPKQQGQGH